jgi:hypothetical protein
MRKQARMRAHTRTHAHTLYDPQQTTAECPNLLVNTTQTHRKKTAWLISQKMSCPEQDGPWFKPQHGQKIYIFPKTALTQHPIQQALFQG